MPIFAPSPEQTQHSPRMTELQRKATRRVAKRKNATVPSHVIHFALCDLRRLQDMLAKAIDALEGGRVTAAETALGRFPHVFDSAMRYLDATPQLRARNQILRDDPEFQTLSAQWSRKEWTRLNKETGAATTSPSE